MNDINAGTFKKQQILVQKMTLESIIEDLLSGALDKDKFLWWIEVCKRDL